MIPFPFENTPFCLAPCENTNAIVLEIPFSKPTISAIPGDLFPGLRINTADLCSILSKERSFLLAKMGYKLQVKISPVFWGGKREWKKQIYWLLLS